MKFLLVITALTVAVGAAVPRRQRIDPLEARRMVTSNFENGTMSPWYDTSPGDVKWVIEDEASPTENYPVPPMTSGTKYLRAKRTYTGSFGTAVLRSVEWLALPGDNITLSFWIRSKVASANSLDVYWLNGTAEVRLMSLTQFSSPSNLEWRTKSAALPITSSVTTSLIIYGMCGANQEDAIAIDNLSLVGASDTTTTLPTTTVSTAAPTTAVTPSTTQTTTTEPASTTEVVTTEISTRPATTTEALETTTTDATTEDVTMPEIAATTKTDESSTLQSTTTTEEFVTSDPRETSTATTEAPEVTTNPTTAEASTVTERTTTTPTITATETTTRITVPSTTTTSIPITTTTTPTTATSTPAATTTTSPPIGGCPSYLATSALPCYRLGSICYCFSTYTDTWYNAESTCRTYTEYRMKLVSLQTGPEQDMIVTHITNTSPLANVTSFWTSASDIDLEGDWKWTSTGESVSSGFVCWARFQPDNLGGNENCMKFDRSASSQWFDDTCWTTNYFICEGNQ